MSRNIDKKIDAIKVEIEELKRQNMKNSAKLRILKQGNYNIPVTKPLAVKIINIDYTKFKVHEVVQQFHSDVRWNKRTIHLERVKEVVNNQHVDVFIIVCPQCGGVFKIPPAWTKLKHGFYIGNYVQHVKFMHLTPSFNTNVSHFIEI